jgi:hypothetical protein
VNAVIALGIFNERSGAAILDVIGVCPDCQDVHALDHLSRLSDDVQTFRAAVKQKVNNGQVWFKWAVALGIVRVFEILKEDSDFVTREHINIHILGTVSPAQISDSPQSLAYFNETQRRIFGIHLKR